MPSKSRNQSKLMHGVASGSIKGSGIPIKVAKEFSRADKGRSISALPKHFKKAGRGR